LGPVSFWRRELKTTLQIPQKGFCSVTVMLVSAVNSAIDIPNIPTGLKEPQHPSNSRGIVL
jgi:hypothetical protein